MEVQIKGMKELFQTLDMLASKIKRKIVKKALRAGATEIKKGIRREARLLRGKGVRAGMTKKGKQRYKHMLEKAIGIVQVYSAMGLRYYVHHYARHAHLVEFGTRAHAITPWRSKGRRRTKRSVKKALLLPGGKFAMSVRHPGSKKKPFFSTGFGKSANESIRKIAQVAEKEIGKLRVKYAR